MMGMLGYAAALTPPRPEVRTRLLANLPGMRAERAGEDRGILAGRQKPQGDWTIVRATEGIWEVAGVRGVVTKRLSPVLAHRARCAWRACGVKCTTLCSGTLP